MISNACLLGDLLRRAVPWLPAPGFVADKPFSWSGDLHVVSVAEIDVRLISARAGITPDGAFALSLEVSGKHPRVPISLRTTFRLAIEVEHFAKQAAQWLRITLDPNVVAALDIAIDES